MGLVRVTLLFLCGCERVAESIAGCPEPPYSSKLHIEPMWPKDAENAVLGSYTSVPVHHIALLEPGCSCGQHFVFVLGLQIVAKLTRYYDGIVIARMDVWWGRDASRILH